MKKILVSALLLTIGFASCEHKNTEKTDKDSLQANASADTSLSVDTSKVAAPTEKKVIPPNSKEVEALLNKPVTTPANNPFNLRAGDNLLKSGAFTKEPLKSRMKTILGDKFDEYVTFLATAKPLKKDSDGFLYTDGAASKGSKNQAFFLYQHEADVLFIGYQKGEERMMLNDMKSRLFAPESVDMWAERAIGE
ncbi:MAG: hypothetical protein ACTHJT_09865 [Cytophaga sp.]|uniref:hypothetical protein n=1 Tax=Cytophaga sp. TaxID=29535 RepID=UPI003F7F763F